MVLRFVFSAGALQTEFTDVRLKVTWETNDREFPVKFSSYTCVGTTNVSFEVADTSCRIQYNEYFSAAARPVNVERSSNANSQQLTIAAPRGTVLPPGTGAVFTWVGGRTRLLQSPQLSLDDLPSGKQLPPAGLVPSTRRPADSPLDPLVNVTGLRIVDAYSLLGVLPSRQFRIRSTVLERLHKAGDLLPDGFELVVLDAWRSLEDQRQLLDHYSLDQSGSQYIASVTGEGMRPPHVTGGAVDVTLAWNGVPLALGSDYDSFDHSSHYDAFESSDGVPRRLRRMLAAAMVSAGFAPYRYEWWHWSYGDDVWGEFVGADSVPFELIEQV
jgi:D-alanyl-D-alanine dipeptidase